MTHSLISTPYSKVGHYAPYSAPAVVVPANAKTIYIQGQVPWDDELNVVAEGDFKEQVRQVFRNLQYVVEQAGGTLNDLVHTLIFLKDMDQFDPDFLSVRTEFYPIGGYSPPATVVEVRRLALDPVMVEIHAVAAIVEA